MGRAGAGQGIQQFRVPEIGADKPFKHPYSPKMGDFRMMDVAHLVRKMNEKIF